MSRRRNPDLDAIIGDRKPFVDRPPDGYRWGLKRVGEPAIVRVRHDFPPESYVVRLLGAQGGAKKRGPCFEWHYYEITGIDAAMFERLPLFAEPLEDWEYGCIPNLLRVEPVTVPARRALDTARAMAGYAAINYLDGWLLENPEVALPGAA